MFFLALDRAVENLHASTTAFEVAAVLGCLSVAVAASISGRVFVKLLETLTEASVVGSVCFLTELRAVESLLAAGTTSEGGTILTLTSTTVTTSIDGVVEISFQTFDGSVLLRDFLASGDILEVHEDDIFFVVRGVAGIGCFKNPFGTEWVRNATAIVLESTVKLDLALWGKATLLVDKKKLLTAPVRDVAAELHGTGNEDTKTVAVTFVA